MTERDRADAAALRAWRRSGGSLRIVVVGRSMAPLLLPGDTIEVLACPAMSLRRGDIVVVEEAGGLLTHRLVRHTYDTLTLWGDALPLADPPVRTDSLIGNVVARERGGRRLVLNGSPWTRIGPLLCCPHLRGLARVALILAIAAT